MYDEHICVTDELIREKAKRSFEQLNQDKSENEKMGMNFSNGWFNKFQTTELHQKISLIWCTKRCRY